MDRSNRVVMDRSNMKLDSKTYTEVAFIHVKQDKTTKLVGTTHTMLVINTPKSYPTHVSDQHT